MSATVDELGSIAPGLSFSEPSKYPEMNQKNSFLISV